MTTLDFYSHAQGIRMAVICAIESYFNAHGLPFEVEDFLAQKETDLMDVSKEALFYGAELFPEDALPS